MGFQDICEDVVRETEDVLGCLVIDISTGLAVASAQRSGMVLDTAEIALALRSGEAMFQRRLPPGVAE